MSNKTVEPVVEIHKTEQIGDTYIREDGKRVRRLKKTVVKWKKKEKVNKPDEEDVYVREDGKRVRRIRKFTQRRANNSVVGGDDDNSYMISDYEMSESFADDGTISVAASSLADASVATKDTVVSRICEKFGGCNLRSATRNNRPTLNGGVNGTACATTAPTTSSSTTTTSLSSTNKTMTKDSTNTSNSDSNNTISKTEPTEVENGSEIYINEKGQKVRRTRRLKQPTATAMNVASGCETYVNEKGQTVRRVRKVRNKIG